MKKTSDLFWYKSLGGSERRYVEPFRRHFDTLLTSFFVATTFDDVMSFSIQQRADLFLKRGFITMYRIRSNYRTYPISAQSRNSVFSDYSQCTFSLLLYKGICCGYSFELHRLVDAIQMSTHNICLYKENQKKRNKTKKKTHHEHQIHPFLIFFYSVSLVGRYIFHHKWVFQAILKYLSAQCGN